MLLANITAFFEKATHGSWKKPREEQWGKEKKIEQNSKGTEVPATWKRRKRMIFLDSLKHYSATHAWEIGYNFFFFFFLQWSAILSEYQGKAMQAICSCLTNKALRLVKKKNLWSMMNAKLNLVDTSQWRNINSLSSDSTRSSNTGWVFSRAAVDYCVHKNLYGILKYKMLYWTLVLLLITGTINML